MLDNDGNQSTVPALISIDLIDLSTLNPTYPLSRYPVIQFIDSKDFFMLIGG